MSDRPTAPPQTLPHPELPHPKDTRRKGRALPKLEKVVIGSLDDPGMGVEAQYNPKELTIDQSVPWSAHKVLHSNQPDLEFAGGDGRSLSFELLFDGFETGQSVETSVRTLAKLGRIRDATSKEDELVRPHIVAVAWASGVPNDATGLGPFRGVIESLQTKYTMFLPNGTPVRATCQIKIKEAARFIPPKSA
jgi:hypothetical protein